MKYLIKVCLFLFFLLLSLPSFSKDIVGYVYTMEKGGRMLVGCNVELLSVKDSSVICSTQSDRSSSLYQNYNFRLPVQTDSTYILRFSMVGYETLYKRVQVKIAKNMNQMNLGFVTLKVASKALPEVVVKATKIKMVMKGDTIVYNADAFALAEGSMLDALIRQLPGCRLENGTIYVNGRRVSSLLVDGRNFFSGDAKVALEHLPAFVVDKVKVYDHSGEASRLMGEDMGDKSLVVDINLKKKYKTGAVEELSAGGGTHDRYNANVNSLVFSKHRDLMVDGGFGNLPNVDNIDASPDPRGAVSYGDKKSYGISGRYSLKGKTFDDDAIGDYSFGGDRQHQLSRSSVENYLAGGNLFTTSDNNTHSKVQSLLSRNYFSKRFKSQIVKFNLFVLYNHNRQEGLSRSGLFNVRPLDNTLWLDSLAQWNTSQTFEGAVHRVIAQNLQRQTSLNVDVSVSTRLAFGKSKGRYGNMIDWDAGYRYRKERGKNFNLNNIDYIKDGGQDYRNNYYDHPSSSSSAYLKASYGHRLTSKDDHVNALFAYVDNSFGYTYDESDNNLYRLDRLTDYSPSRYPLGMLPSSTDDLLSVLDATNSSHNRSHTTKDDANFRLELTRGDGIVRPRITAKLQVPVTWMYEKLSYTQERNYEKSRSSVLVSPQLEADFDRTDSTGTRSLNLSYQLTPSQPQLLTLLGVRNDDNPLFVRLGNTNLKQSRNHSLSLTYSSMSMGMGNTSWRVQAGGMIMQDAFGTHVTYDRATGKTTSQQVNVNGNWSVNGSASYSRGLDANHNFDITVTLNSNYAHSVDLNNTIQSGESSGNAAPRSKVYTVNTDGSVYLTYHKGSDITLMLIGSVSNNNTSGSRDDFVSTHATTYFGTLQGTVKLPLSFEFISNISDMKRTGFSDDSMNDNSIVWNARIAKTFCKGAFTVGLDAYDILGQVKQTQVTLDAQGRTEVWTNALPRYLLLHCSYKFHLGMKQ